MEDTHLYENLAHHLDQGIVGAPTSPALLEILRILFPFEEARVALKLTMQNRTLAELMKKFALGAVSVPRPVNQRQLSWLCGPRPNPHRI